jgi:hypothetical protein
MLLFPMLATQSRQHEFPKEQVRTCWMAFSNYQKEQEFVCEAEQLDCTVKRMVASFV